MKKIIFLLLGILVFASTSQAQNNVKVRIHHKLGNEAFNFEQATTNNLDHDFMVTRLQYYLSEIAIIHDQGMETYVPNVWALVNASEATVIDLGEHDFTEVEGVSFSVGVDLHHNHADPATFPADHPLAPQSPSMHWGWTSGYRFVVLEGKASPNLDQTIELHGLGDPNYFRQSLLYPATAQDNEIVIHLDADYNRALENLEIDQGLVIHGNFSGAKTIIENFRDYVFSPTTEILSVVDFSEVNSFEVFPNPVINKTANFKVNASKDADYEVIVSDLLGKVVQRFENVQSNTVVELALENAGLYFVNLRKQGHNITTEKLIVH